jgi:pimeloyl-ACP methyl ester carboxylesterase
VLLHALGSSRRSWDPVVQALTEHFDVLAIDLPGFGEAAPLPATVAPSPPALATAIAATLDARGISNPHVVGNSIGGWVALELAAVRPLASLSLLSPAGMWPRSTPRYCRVSLRTTRWLAVHLAPVLNKLVGTRIGRTLVLGQAYGRPGRVSAEHARAAIHALGTCVGFDATLATTIHTRYASTTDLHVPVSIAYGSRDRILLRRRWRGTDRLPPDTSVAALPGCGHIPMTDDPDAVAQFILRSTRRRSARP